MRKLILLLLSTMLWAQQPQTTNPLVANNSKWTNGVAPGYWPTAGSGFTLNLSAGTCVLLGAVFNYTGGTLTMTGSATNYVYLDPTSNCVPAVNTTSFLGPPVAVVTTNGGGITNIQDVRTLFAPGSGNGGGTPIFKTETSNYQILTSDFSIPSTGCGVVYYASSTSTVTTPPSGSVPPIGQCITILVGGGVVSLAAGATTTILGAGPTTMFANQSVTVWSIGSTTYFATKTYFDDNSDANYVAGYSSRAGGGYNTNVGYGNATGGSFTGVRNTFIGAQNGASISSGTDNFFGGFDNGGSLTSGNLNIFIGYSNGVDGPSTANDDLLMGYSGAAACDDPSNIGNLVCIGNLFGGSNNRGIVWFEGPTTNVTACGSSPSLSVGSNDTTGQVVVGTSASNSCKLNFNSTHNVEPYCIITPFTTAIVLSGETTSYFTVTAPGGNLDSIKFNYHCFMASNLANPTP